MPGESIGPLPTPDPGPAGGPLPLSGQGDSHAGRPTARPFATMVRRADFVAANKGLRVSRPGLVLLAHSNGGKGMRAGITVTKRIGNAVVRNRMKRRFRALLREVLPGHGLADTDHVVIGREGGVERDFALLRGELLAALERAAQGKGDGPRRPRGDGKRR
jgi:ribonuclease P protein component